MNKNKYVYNGPVMEYSKCITNHWEACTYASSEKEAKSNITYQFKKANNKILNAKITLPAKIIMVQ